MPKYRIHGTDKETGDEQSMTITADSDRDAAYVATGRGLVVSRIVEIETVAAPATQPTTASTLEPDAEGEQLLWEGSPSQWTNFLYFLLCGLFCWLLIPIFMAIWRYLVTHYTRFELTSERLLFKSGVLSQHIEEIELYRVKDMSVTRPFIQRMLGLGNVDLITSDKSTPHMVLPAIRDADRVRDMIRRRVEHLRLTKRVREVDYE